MHGLRRHWRRAARKAGEMQTSLNCATCKGHKVAPTAAGQQLLDFVQRRLGLSEKEAHRSMFG